MNEAAFPPLPPGCEVYTPADPLGIVSIGDAPPVLSAAYVVKGLIAPEQRALLIGEPGSGKSTLGPLLAHRIARGEPFLAFKTLPGPILWVAAEDAVGTIRRFRALAQELGPAPGIFVATATIDLLDPAAALPGAAAIRDAADRIGARLVVIDTLAAAFPGLNENDPGEMGHAVRTIRSLTGPGRATLTLHHVPKGGTSPRGHGVLLGDADCVLLVEADESGERTLRLRKNRNGPGLGTWGFSITSVELGRDDEGDAVTAPMAVFEDVARAKRGKPLSPRERTALGFLHDVVAVSGDALPGSLGLPRDLRGVRIADWFAECERRHLTASDDPKNRRDVFSRVASALRDKGAIGLGGGYAWPL